MDNIIEVKDLVKIYDPNIKAVDKISFDVKRGEIFGFLGPNGAGKSTTIKILTTLLKKTSGKVVVDGIDIDENPGEVRKIIGYAAQEVGVDDDLTGRENLKLQCSFYHIPREKVNQKVDDLLKALDLTEAADRRAGTYSGGMRKRLDIAAALIHEPKLMFLDEPTTGLDPQTRKATWEYIKQLNKNGTTIFLTTQYMEEADKLADRLSIIDLGHIVAEGTPTSLKSEIAADVVQIVLKENGNRKIHEEAKSYLKRMSGIKEVKDYEDGIAVFGQNGSSLIPHIVRALDTAKIGIDQLTLTGPTLDEVFLKHTGRKMRVEEVKPPGRTPWGMRRR